MALIDSVLDRIPVPVNEAHSHPGVLPLFLPQLFALHACMHCGGTIGTAHIIGDCTHNIIIGIALVLSFWHIFLSCCPSRPPMVSAEAPSCSCCIWAGSAASEADRWLNADAEYRRYAHRGCFIWRFYQWVFAAVLASS